MEKHTEYGEWVLLSGILALHLILSVYLSLKLNIWLDEAYTLNTTGADLKYAFWQSIRGEHQAPLYFILLKIWTYMNNSVFFARLFSVLAVFLAGVSCVALSKRYFENLHPAYLVFSVVLNPFAIWASLEIRLYAFVILLVCMNMILFHDIFIEESKSKKKMFLYIFVALAGVYTHYYFGFLILSNFAWIFFVKDRKTLKRFTIIAVVLAIGIFPVLLMVKYQLSTAIGVAYPEETFFYDIALIYGRIKTFILPVDWAAQQLGKYFFKGILFLFAVIVLKNRNSLQLKQKALWIQIVVLVLCFLFAIQLTGRDLMNLRHTVVLFVPLIMGVWAIFDIVSWRSRRFYLFSWTVLLSICYVMTIVDDYRPMAKIGDWNRVATFIMENERPGEPILVFPNFVILPLQHYYGGSNSLVMIPRDLNLSNLNIYSAVIKDEFQIRKAISRVCDRCESLWIVDAGICKYMGVDLGCEVWDDFIRKYYVVESIQDFHRVRILLVKTSGN